MASNAVLFVDNVLRETDLAILCVVANGEVWVPKSLISDGSEVWSEGDSGELVVPQWFAEENELE